MIDASFWEQLANQGWAVSEPSDVPWRTWSSHVEDLFDRRKLRLARVGRADGAVLRQDIRGDAIAWIPEDDFGEVAKSALHWLEQLRSASNEQLWLGLRWTEAHWARYPAGQGYDWHFDQHGGKVGRRLTFVYYLNENWNADDAGEIEMRIHGESPRSMKFEPAGGRLLIFRSDLFEHRVHASLRPRKTLTGWFRDDALP